MDVPFRRVAGRFYRAMPVARVANVFDSPGPDSAGRYHRPGEPALYLTPEPDWAMLAVGRYLTVDGPRVVVPVEVSGADVVDQRDPTICRTLGIDPVAAAGRWQHALAEGREPASWVGSDAARRAGADVIIDPSRGIAGGWHVTLFRWNGHGGPRVTVAGDPLAIDYDEARARWPVPEGWADPR